MNYELFEYNVGSVAKKIFLVDMRKEINYHFSELFLSGVKKYLAENKKILLIVNKKGYSSGTLCLNCGHIPECKNCSVSVSRHMDIHKNEFAMCHICKTQYDVPHVCPNCGSDKIKPYGMGIQKVADFIKSEYDYSPLVLDSSKINSPNKIKKVMAEIKNYNIVVATSLLSSKLKGMEWDLIFFLNADLGLNMPSYDASENNFYLLRDSFVNHNSHFIVQSFNPEHYSIRYACMLDEDGFREKDNHYRNQYNYPPFVEMCTLIYKHEIEERLHANVDKIHKELLYYKEKYGLDDMEIYTVAPVIYKKFGKYRYNVVLKGNQLRQFMDIVYSKCKLAQRGFKLDFED